MTANNINQITDAIDRAEDICDPLEEEARGAAAQKTEPDVLGSELPDFPETAWRSVFADYRDAVRGCTEASDVFHFVSLWAAVAVSLGRHVWMFSAP